MVKSPLRYPGGKQKSIYKITALIPKKFNIYCEPFLGGGSVYLNIRENYPDIKCLVNDLNPELIIFWKQVQTNLDNLVKNIITLRQEYYNDGQLLFDWLRYINPLTLPELGRATRFFILNRITFSGTIESGGYSTDAFKKRFTDSSIDRLSFLNQRLTKTFISNIDYSYLVKIPDKDIFFFLDPPYLLKTGSNNLYGNRGNLHSNFNHAAFADHMRQCKHQWLITYNDCQQVRDNFSFANIHEQTLIYSMGAIKQGKELFITNY